MWYPFLVVLVLSSTIDLSNQDVIDNILMSLSKGIAYFDMQGRNINLDGVVGYLILQGKPLLFILLFFYHCLLDCLSATFGLNYEHRFNFILILITICGIFFTHVTFQETFI